MEIDRTALLDQIRVELGIVERDDDEFTAREIAYRFGIYQTNVIQFFETNDINYKRRKAMVDGRRQYVYKFILEEK